MTAVGAYRGVQSISGSSWMACRWRERTFGIAPASCHPPVCVRSDHRDWRSPAEDGVRAAAPWPPAQPGRARRPVCPADSARWPALPDRARRSPRAPTPAATSRCGSSVCDECPSALLQLLPRDAHERLARVARGDAQPILDPVARQLQVRLVELAGLATTAPGV